MAFKKEILFLGLALILKRGERLTRDMWLVTSTRVNTFI